MSPIAAGSIVPPLTCLGKLGLLLVILFLGGRAEASDHADPIFNDRLEAGITDLFVFPTTKDRLWRKKTNGKSDGKDAGKDQADRYLPIVDSEAENLVVILCTRRSLAKPPPYEGLDQLTFKIHMDLGTDPEQNEPRAALSLDNKFDLDRYGATVERPELIKADVTFTIQLNNDVSFRLNTIEGKRLKRKGEVEWYCGVRDDPFIFPQFFGTNVIAVVLNIPLVCFPSGQRDWLVWATSARHGSQIDHVGRSQRTQLPRFDFLNTLPPHKHVEAIRQRRDNPGLIQDIARTRLMPLFAIRPYDLVPDVMIFTRRRETGFPNGRLLSDDVADLTCKQGDCQLFEASFSHRLSAMYPKGRPDHNDREFLDSFPYLAEPWPSPKEPSPPALMAKNRALLIVLIVLLVGFVLLPWVLYFWTVRRLRVLGRARDPLRQPPPSSLVPRPSS